MIMPGRAEAALQRVVVVEGLLHGMQLAVGAGQPLDRGHLVAVGLHGQHRAALHAHAVEQHRARAAVARVAADDRADLAQLLAQVVHEQQAGFDVVAVLDAIDSGFDPSHGGSISTGGVCSCSHKPVRVGGRKVGFSSVKVGIRTYGRLRWLVPRMRHTSRKLPRQPESPTSSGTDRAEQGTTPWTNFGIAGLAFYGACFAARQHGRNGSQPRPALDRLTRCRICIGSGRLQNSLGVSDDTLRRWIDLGRIKAKHVANRRTEIAGVDLARFAEELAANAERPDVGSIQYASARNRMVGLVTRVVRDTVMAQVEMQAGPYRIVSLMSQKPPTNSNSSRARSPWRRSKRPTS